MMHYLQGLPLLVVLLHFLQHVCGEDYEKRAKITKNANIFFIFAAKNTSFLKKNSFIVI